MNIKTTITLLVFLVFAGVALLLTTGSNTQKRPDQTRTDSGPLNTNKQDRAVIPIHRGTPTQISLNYDPASTGSDLELVSKRGRWRVAYPHRFPANRKAIDQLLTSLGSLQGSETTQRFSEPDSSQSLLLTLQGDNAYAIRLGPRLGAGKALLAVSPLLDSLTRDKQNKKDLFYEVEDTLHDLMDSFNPAVFYTNKLDPPLISELERIEITQPSGTSHLVQQQGGWWIGNGATKERALEISIEEQPGVQAFFKLLQAIELNEFRAYQTQSNLSAFGLADPLIRIRLYQTEQHGLEIRVGVPADPNDQSRFISAGAIDSQTPAVFVTATPLALSLGTEATAFRDPRIIATPPTLIAELKLTDQALNQSNPQHSPAAIDPEREPRLSAMLIRFESDGSAKLASAKDRSWETSWQTISQKRAGQLIESLSGVRARAYVAEGLEQLQPLKSVELTAKLGRPTERLMIYHDPESDDQAPTLLVRREQESVALRVKHSALEALLDPTLLLEGD